jgi:SAM-dependent methyltransferase
MKTQTARHAKGKFPSVASPAFNPRSSTGLGSKTNHILGSVNWWNDYFSEGGGWERNGGRKQTEIFAETFCAIVKLPIEKKFTLLDVGCGLGDGLRVIAGHYPNAVLRGIDISSVAISRCVKEAASRATFAVSTLEAIKGNYDVIYISNVLEHFPDFQDKARFLSRKCGRLCILVPFEERWHGRKIVPNPDEHHQHTFGRGEFDFLLAEKRARSIKEHIVSCPGAWGWSESQRLKEHLKNVLRICLGRPMLSEPRQIIYDVEIAL